MILKIHYYGDPLLRRKAQEVKNFDRELKRLVEDMFETMENNEGVGLAAPQVGVSQRVLVIDLKRISGERLVMINPKLQLSGSKESLSEGCLSIPGISGEVVRPVHVRVEGFDADGKKVELEAEGMLARVLQHEVDHLDGIFFVDRMNPVRRALINRKLKRLEKDNISGKLNSEKMKKAEGLF